MKYKSVTIIGLGGIGSHLVEDVIRDLYHHMPTYGIGSVTLIDGDKYTESNLSRMRILKSDIGQNKAVIWARALSQEFGDKLEIIAMGEYVGKSNIHRVPMEQGITLVGVDNFAARKLISDYFSGCDRMWKGMANGVLISGGNNLTDGSVLLTVREKGKNLLPPIDTFHPEISSPKDKNPADLSCLELSKLKGGGQIMAANKEAAGIMYNMFRLAVEGQEKFLFQQGEVYFDVNQNARRTAVRMVPKEAVADKPKVTAKRKEGKKSEKKEEAMAFPVSGVTILSTVPGLGTPPPPPAEEVKDGPLDFSFLDEDISEENP